jgi:peptidoglycan/LPS O-acetylase OafA/YrhL
MISWAIAFGVFLTAFLHRSWILINNRLARYLGKISYSIYLVHGLVIPGVVASVARLHGSPLLALPAIAAVTIAISSVTYRYIEHPAISYSHRLRRGKLPLAQEGGASPNPVAPP